ncbi:MAG: BatA domain-containing protein, partial [Phycisphaerae bacterium]|nr:BatA domain-containing protein [Phycisphaerae bacterium]
MPFIHPILFWLGVAGISIPIIIHILNRRRFKIIEWAAMKFLLDALRKNRKRLRIEELILLALRCLIVLLLGLALGRFVGCSAVDTLGIGDGSSSVVFILDDSYSMAQARGQKTEFDRARDDLKKQIELLGGKDQVAVLQTSRPGREDAFFRFGEITDRPALLGRMDALQPSDMRTGLADSLQTAANLLKGTAGQKQVYVFGDFRRVDLADESQAARMKTIYADLQAAGVKVIAMDYGRSARNNLTIEKIELLDKFAVSGQTARIALTVKNNGQVLARSVPIDMSVMFYDGKKMRDVALPIQTIESLEPNQFWRREISFTPETPAVTVISAKLPDDDLAGDNRAMVSLDVRKATKVLIVDGRPGGARAEDAESYFLRLGLDPAHDGSHGFAVETISRDDLGDAVFGDYDVVFLLDLENFPIQPLVSKDGKTTENYLAVARLEKFVAAGGGLVIFTGDKVDTDFYNGRLYKKGAGLNPLPIRSRLGNPRNRERYFTIDPKSIKPTGIMSFFSGEASAIAKLIRFFAVTPADDKNLLVADKIAAAPVIEATFNDRNTSPAVVSRRYGRGQVVVIYSTASLRWNDWA